MSSYYDTSGPQWHQRRKRDSRNYGEAFELVEQIDRLVAFHRKNKPGQFPDITVPDDWKGKPIKELLPKFAEHSQTADKWFYRGYPLKFKGV
jgi:hypothetical protein